MLYCTTTYNKIQIEAKKTRYARNRVESLATGASPLREAERGALPLKAIMAC